MKIGVWLWTGDSFDGLSVRERPCGGTETAVVYTCEALARRGCDVSIYTRDPQRPAYNGVNYHSCRNLQERIGRTDFDAFIIVRHMAPLLTCIRTRCVAYWAHDNASQPWLHGVFCLNRQGARNFVLHLGEAAPWIDIVLAVSRWQRLHISDTFGFDINRIATVGNGISPGIGRPVINGERQPIVLFTLPPDRNLTELIPIFEIARERIPSLQLHAYSRSTLYSVPDELDRQRFGDLYQRLARTDGVSHFDPVDQPTLWAAMSRAMIYAYPSTVEETFSVSVLEAQGNGVVPITSPVGALAERVDHGKTGFLVSGDPTSTLYQKRFADHIVDLIQDRGLWQTMSRNAAEHAQSSHYDYNRIAESVIQALDASATRNVRPVQLPLGAISAASLRSDTGAVAGSPTLSPSEVQSLRDAYRDLFHLW